MEGEKGIGNGWLDDFLKATGTREILEKFFAVFTVCNVTVFNGILYGKSFAFRRQGVKLYFRSHLYISYAKFRHVHLLNSRSRSCGMQW